jgi:superfamily II DNA or RNA helicase
LLATGQLIGEGADFPNLDCLFLVFPFAFKGKIIQYIGRIQRGGNEGIVYDYRDLHVEYLEKLFKQRFRFYKKNFEIKE